MCLAPDGKTLFVSTAGSKSVTVIDLASRAASGSLTAPGMQSPDGCALTADSRKLYSVDQRSAAVFVFSAESGTFIKKIAVGKEPRHPLPGWQDPRVQRTVRFPQRHRSRIG